MKIRRMVVAEFGRDLVEERAPLPGLQPGEVLVKVLATGVCPVDVQAWQGLDPQVAVPVVLGHEAVGVVEDLAGEHRDIDGEPLKQGDLVAWNRELTCGECHFCRVLHQPEHCPWRASYGATRSGSFAERMVLDARTQILKVPVGTELSLVTLSECAGAAVARVFEESPPRAGTAVLILGSGSLGMFAAAFSRARGAFPIIVIGGHERRLEVCLRLGATHAVDRRTLTREEREQRIRALTSGRGADWALETTGTGEALREALDEVRDGGTCCTTGYGGQAGGLQLNPAVDLVRRGLTLRGGWLGRMGHARQALEVVGQHMDAFADVVTHRYGLGQATEALCAIGRPDVLKAVVFS